MCEIRKSNAVKMHDMNQKSLFSSVTLHDYRTLILLHIPTFLTVTIPIDMW